MSSTGNTAATKGDLGRPASPANAGNQSPKRRVSTLKLSATVLLLQSILNTYSFPQDSHSKGYAGLVNQKRNSLDETAKARRDSFNDQKPAAGIIGNMWNK